MYQSSCGTWGTKSDLDPTRSAGIAPPESCNRFHGFHSTSGYLMSRNVPLVLHLTQNDRHNGDRRCDLYQTLAPSNWRNQLHGFHRSSGWLTPGNVPLVQQPIQKYSYSGNKTCDLNQTCSARIGPPMLRNRFHGFYRSSGYLTSDNVPLVPQLTHKDRHNGNRRCDLDQIRSAGIVPLELCNPIHDFHSTSGSLTSGNVPLVPQRTQIGGGSGHNRCGFRDGAQRKLFQ